MEHGSELRPFDLKKLELIQKKYAGKFKTQKIEGVEIIAGVDCHYRNDQIVCVAVATDLEGNILNRVKVEGKNFFPYIPTFFAFREGPWMVAALRKLLPKPQVVFVDGNGRLHPRKAGLAVFVGVRLNIPTIGFSKNPMKNLPEKCTEKEIILMEDGAAICRRGWKKPVFISPGNLITLEDAIDLYQQLAKTKLPPPLKIAHSQAKHSISAVY